MKLIAPGILEKEMAEAGDLIVLIITVLSFPGPSLGVWVPSFLLMYLSFGGPLGCLFSRAIS